MEKHTTWYIIFLVILVAVIPFIVDVCLSDAECDIVQRETVKLLANTERATLERVQAFADEVGDYETLDWCEKQAKEQRL